MEKLKILGTAASEGIPALFCRCELCREAKRLGGKNIRTRTSAIIGEKFKIDFPPDSLHHVQKYGLDMGRLEYLVISHCHSDHFDVEDLEYYRKTMAHLDRSVPLKIFLSKDCHEHLINTVECFRTMEDMNPAELIIIEPYKRYETDMLYFTPVITAHSPDMQCFNYFIEMKQGKNIFYGMDAKAYPPETLEFLKSCRIDVCICDATHLYEPCSVHMYYPDIVNFHAYLKDNGILGKDYRFVVNHFSHNGNNGQEGGNLMMLHENLERIYGEMGFTVAFDGLELEV